MMAAAVMPSAAMPPTTMPSATMVVMMDMQERMEVMEADRPDQHGRTAIRPPWAEGGFVESGRRGDVRPDRFRAGYQDSRQDDRCEDSEPAHTLDMDGLGRNGKRASMGRAASQAIVIACDPPVNLPVDLVARLHGKFAF